MKIQRLTRAGIITGVVALAAGSAAAQPVTALDSIGGGVYSRAEDINDLGQVVGASSNGTAIEATVWDRGAASGLGIDKGTDHSFAMAINNNGEATGYSEIGANAGENTNAKSALFWGSGGLINIGASMGLTSSRGNDINNNGVVAMQGNKPGGTAGYAWNTTMGGTQAGADPIYDFGSNFGINDRNNIVGYAAAGFDGAQAIHTTFNGAGWDVGTEIGPQAVRDPAAAEAISNTGIVVGQGGDGKAHIFEAAMFTLNPKDPVNWLGKLAGFDDSSAHDVNDSGLVVGHSTFFGIAVDQRAVAWADGQIFDLNNLLHAGSDFAVLVSATGVNNNGDIVGYGLLNSGEVSAFVINGFVPAPGAAVALLGGIAAFGRRRRS
ncbi:MAG: putative HAF family extracellular repeat protein [Phycisphaerales bacterium]|jgi:probable HAF family extracellular repeat protein